MNSVPSPSNYQIVLLSVVLGEILSFLASSLGHGGLFFLEVCNFFLVKSSSVGVVSFWELSTGIELWECPRQIDVRLLLPGVYGFNKVDQFLFCGFFITQVMQI